MMANARIRTLVSLAAAVLLLAPAAAAQANGGPVVSYRKVFKDSSPEFLEIKLHANGNGTIELRQLDDEPEPETMEVSQQLAAKVFELAGELDHFRGVQLDVRRRIANLGEKTFRFERGSESNETTFNYTINPAAQQLMQIFEGLARQYEHLSALSRRMRYDRLGVNDALLRFEVDLNRKLIPEPERLLPVLETIGNDTRVVDIARQRARMLAERIRQTRPS